MKKIVLGILLAFCWCTGTVNAQDIAAKTNLLYWSTTTPNLGLEFGVGKRATLNLTGAYNPWTLNKDTNKKIRHWLVMPEFRYWLCERFNGHGYSWLLGKRWNLEATVGLGYIYSKYDKYECATCGKFKGNRDKHYFGPTKVGISLIYIIK